VIEGNFHISLIHILWRILNPLRSPNGLQLPVGAPVHKNVSYETFLFAAIEKSEICAIIVFIAKKGWYKNGKSNSNS